MSTYQLVPVDALATEARRWPGEHRWKVYAQDASRVESVPLYGQPGRYGQVRVTDGWNKEGGTYETVLAMAQRRGAGRYLIAMFSHPPEVPYSSAWRGRLATVIEVLEDGSMLPAHVPVAIEGSDVALLE